MPSSPIFPVGIRVLHDVAECGDHVSRTRASFRAHGGGVAATCRYTNLEVVVARDDGDEPVYNNRFLVFATHLGFRPVARRVRRSDAAASCCGVPTTLVRGA